MNMEATELNAPSEAANMDMELRRLTPEQRALILGIPDYIIYLIAGADGEIDIWEKGAALEAIDDTILIAGDFTKCKDKYEAEVAPFIEQMKVHVDESDGTLINDLGWMIPKLQEYKSLMEALSKDLQSNIRTYVSKAGLAIAKASDSGEIPDVDRQYFVGPDEHVFLKLIWDAFGLEHDNGLQAENGEPNSSNSPQPQLGALA